MGSLIAMCQRFALVISGSPPWRDADWAVRGAGAGWGSRPPASTEKNVDDIKTSFLGSADIEITGVERKRYGYKATDGPVWLASSPVSPPPSTAAPALCHLELRPCRRRLSWTSFSSAQQISEQQGGDCMDGPDRIGPDLGPKKTLSDKLRRVVRTFTTKYVPPALLEIDKSPAAR